SFLSSPHLRRVQLTCLNRLRLAQDDEVVRPWQLSHQRRDFSVRAVRLVELPHPKEIRARVAAEPGVARREIGRELLDHAIAHSALAIFRLMYPPSSQ